MPVGSTSSKCVSQTAARSNKKKAVKLAEQNQTSGVIGLVVAAMLGGFLWWRQKRSGGAGSGKGSGSASAPTKATTRTGAASASSSLPRNQVANNKKNKARKKSERNRKESKRREETAAGGSSSSTGPSNQPREPDPNNDKLMLNYHHWTDTN